MTKIVLSLRRYIPQFLYMIKSHVTYLQYGFFAYTLQAYASQISKQVVFLTIAVSEFLCACIYSDHCMLLRSCNAGPKISVRRLCYSLRTVSPKRLVWLVLSWHNRGFTSTCWVRHTTSWKCQLTSALRASLMPCKH